MESRRGGNGYIRITRVQTDRKTLLMQVINSIGDSLDYQSARAITGNLAHSGAIEMDVARILLSAISENALKEVPRVLRNTCLLYTSPCRYGQHGGKPHCRQNVKGRRCAAGGAYTGHGGGDQLNGSRIEYDKAA